MTQHLAACVCVCVCVCVRVCVRACVCAIGGGGGGGVDDGSIPCITCMQIGSYLLSCIRTGGVPSLFTLF